MHNDKNIGKRVVNRIETCERRKKRNECTSCVYVGGGQREKERELPGGTKLDEIIFLHLLMEKM